MLLFSGFMLFSFMTNIGPNAMTYLIAGEVFPVAIRGAGAGFAASFAKIGLTSALIIDGAAPQANFTRAARNIRHVDVLAVEGINVYDILRREKLVLTRAAVDALEARFK